MTRIIYNEVITIILVPRDLIYDRELPQLDVKDFLKDLVTVKRSNCNKPEIQYL